MSFAKAARAAADKTPLKSRSAYGYGNVRRFPDRLGRDLPRSREERSVEDRLIALEGEVAELRLLLAAMTEGHGESTESTPEKRVRTVRQERENAQAWANAIGWEKAGDATAVKAFLRAGGWTPSKAWAAWVLRTA